MRYLDWLLGSVPRGCVPQGGGRGGRVPHVPGTRGLQGGRFPTSPFWGDAGGLGGTRLPKVEDKTPQKGDSWTSPLEKGDFWTWTPPQKGDSWKSPPNFFCPVRLKKEKIKFKKKNKKQIYIKLIYVIVEIYHIIIIFFIFLFFFIFFYIIYVTSPRPPFPKNP
jgi:hypothetical protein